MSKFLWDIKREISHGTLQIKNGKSLKFIYMRRQMSKYFWQYRVPFMLT